MILIVKCPQCEKEIFEFSISSYLVDRKDFKPLNGQEPPIEGDETISSCCKKNFIRINKEKGFLEIYTSQGWIFPK